MNSTFYSIDGLYRIVRQHYVDKFPYPTPSNNITIINKELKGVGSHASLSYDGSQNLIIKNQSPAIKTDSVFGENPAFILEEYLSNPQNCDALINDISQLRKWLLKEGYLYESGINHIATGLLLRTYNLTK